MRTIVHLGSFPDLFVFYCAECKQAEALWARRVPRQFDLNPYGARRAPCEPSLAAFEHLLGDERRGHRRRPTGVERKMGNDLAQFALFEPVVERALQVADQLLLAAERYQGGARDQAAVALGEAGALPYLPEQHPLAEIDEGRDDVADLVTR